jgi:hypothetical protein
LLKVALNTKNQINQSTEAHEFSMTEWIDKSLWKDSI